MCIAMAPLLIVGIPRQDRAGDRSGCRAYTSCAAGRAAFACGLAASLVMECIAMASTLLMLAFLQNLGLPEMIVIGLLALLLFGRRLPEVGRSLGKGIVEFKKGLRDVEDEVDTAGEAKKLPRPPSGGNDKDAGGSSGAGG